MIYVVEIQSDSGAKARKRYDAPIINAAWQLSLDEEECIVTSHSSAQEASTSRSAPSHVVHTDRMRPLQGARADEAHTT
jgi:hypothetical protein